MSHYQPSIFGEFKHSGYKIPEDLKLQFNSKLAAQGVTHGSFITSVIRALVNDEILIIPDSTPRVGVRANGDMVEYYRKKSVPLYTKERRLINETDVL